MNMTRAVAGERGAGERASHDRRPPAPVHPVPVSPVEQTVLQRSPGCACGGGCPRCSGAASSRYTVNTPGDRYEQEADRVAERVMRMSDPVAERAADLSAHGGPTLQRACAACGEKREDGEEETLQRKESGGHAVDTSSGAGSGTSSGGRAAPGIVDDVLRASGRPLDAETRAFMEPRFGSDFGGVRVHTDDRAAESASAVSARAYTVGQSVVFGRGEYRPGTAEGRHLLAHELAHVVQQRGGSGGMLQRSLASGSSGEPLPYGERPIEPLFGPPSTPRRPQPIPRPEHCPPPLDMPCQPATTSPGSVVEALNFPQDVATLNPMQKLAIDRGVLPLVRGSGGPRRLRVDGYASAEGECSYNWNLSCRRAQAIVAELVSPSDGSAGMSRSDIEMYAHGESDEWGRALGPNRNGIISMPLPPPRIVPPPQQPTCTLPISLGHNRPRRACGGGADFRHFDRPAISTRSAALLAAWAAARPFSRGPFRSLVTDFECEREMDTVLMATSGSAGHDAFTRFVAGTGGTVTHGASSTLGALALTSPSFTATVTRVQRALEAQLAAQASSGSGALDPCGLALSPAAITHFPLGGPDAGALQGVLGGTQGEEQFLTSFAGSSTMRTYSMDVRFVICDDFGVDESDLYFWGLFAFWVLQHERSATAYAPFINEVDLTVHLSGTF